MQTELMPKVETTAVALRDATPAQLMVEALKAGATPEVIGKMMDLQDRWDAKQAKKAYDESMAAFQGACPIIDKSKRVMNKDGSTVRYRFAPLDAIVRQVGPILRTHGFSYTIDAVVEDKWVQAVCKITHTAGHSQTSSFKVPIDPDAYMSAPQRFASALTFAKRYAFTSAFGILTGDEDNDAAPEAPHQASPRQKPADAKRTFKAQCWEACSAFHKGDMAKYHAWLVAKGLIGDSEQLAGIQEPQWQAIKEQLAHVL